MRSVFARERLHYALRTQTDVPVSDRPSLKTDELDFFADEAISESHASVRFPSVPDIRKPAHSNGERPAA